MSAAKKVTYAYDPAVQMELMLSTLGNTGPVNLGMCGSTIGSYSSGIYDGSCCTTLNHDITVVGYGEEGGIPYWIIKNRSALPVQTFELFNALSIRTRSSPQC